MSDIEQTTDSPAITPGVSIKSEGSEKSHNLQKIPEFLGLTETRMVVKPSGNKRNRSLSPSEPETEQVIPENAAESKSYTSPSEIAKIFQNMITTEALCQLSSMLRGTPSDVKKIIPKATVGQICKNV